MRAMTASTPSNLPTDMLNWRRMRVYAPEANTPPLAPPVAFEGSEMQRPTDSCSTSMRQPWPAIFGPPIMVSSGTNTSLPDSGPFWNGTLSGKWRRPMVRPAASRGISAQVMP